MYSFHMLNQIRLHLYVVSTESSCLKDHLFSKHIVDSPTCQCSLVENNNHCLLQCQRFAAPREVLLASMAPLLPPNIRCSTNLLLYGHTLETNTNL